jgi:hypothetical protein
MMTSVSSNHRRKRKIDEDIVKSCRMNTKAPGASCVYERMSIHILNADSEDSGRSNADHRIEVSLKTVNLSETQCLLKMNANSHFNIP